jgi:hypothetical protein
LLGASRHTQIFFLKKKANSRKSLFSFFFCFFSFFVSKKKKQREMLSRRFGNSKKEQADAEAEIGLEEGMAIMRRRRARRGQQGLDVELPLAMFLEQFREHFPHVEDPRDGHDDSIPKQFARDAFTITVSASSRGADTDAPSSGPQNEDDGDGAARPPEAEDASASEPAQVTDPAAQVTDPNSVDMDATAASVHAHIVAALAENDHPGVTALQIEAVANQCPGVHLYEHLVTKYPAPAFMVLQTGNHFITVTINAGTLQVRFQAVFEIRRMDDDMDPMDHSCGGGGGGGGGGDGDGDGDGSPVSPQASFLVKAEIIIDFLNSLVRLNFSNPFLSSRLAHGGGA